MQAPRFLEIATVRGVVSPAVYIAADVAAATRYPGYSYADQAVSELFAIGAPTSALVPWNFFPMHVRGATPTFTDTMHLVLAANPYWLLGLIFAAIGFGGAFRCYSISTIVVLLALAAYGFSFARVVSTNGPTPWMGRSERGAQYAAGLWQMVLALVVWKDCRNSGETI